MGANLVNYDMPSGVIVITDPGKQDHPQGSESKQKLSPARRPKKLPHASQSQNKRNAVCPHKPEDIQQQIQIMLQRKNSAAKKHIQHAGDNRQNHQRIAERIRRHLRFAFLPPASVSHDGCYKSRYDK